MKGVANLCGRATLQESPSQTELPGRVTQEAGNRQMAALYLRAADGADAPFTRELLRRRAAGLIWPNPVDNHQGLAC